ncbi:MAG: sodium:solute symporter [Saprospirales bacterium]|nr:sodium:solute symporter [Saprospirales bacterium]
MHLLDWIIMLGTLLGIVAYGVWRTRSVQNVSSYLKGDRDLPWWTIGLSIMATQASAITFLSTPGQAYDDGMRFVQFYFGMPIAMVILCIFVLPVYYRLNVYTAYEYLEGRFDLKTRSLTALFFLIQRGLAAGITIYAPSIILSTIMGWSLFWTNISIGSLVIIYTVAGGTKAVSVTQKQQMIVILTGMLLAALIVVWKLPGNIGFTDALTVAGKMGKLNVVDFNFDLKNRYNFWSGILGGTFLFLSYFGTDQSQVQRYLSGKSLTQSRLGLLFNGVVKVPMQFLVLLTGILVFVFYQFSPQPLHFNTTNVEKVIASEYKDDYQALEAEFATIFEEKKDAANQLVLASNQHDQPRVDALQATVKQLAGEEKKVRNKAKDLIKKVDESADTKDEDYVFITFIMHNMPIGVIGLLLAVIFSAAMSSIASELSALATTTVIDIYRRSFVREKTDKHYFHASRWFTFLWGLMALFFAMVAAQFENLIEAVNIVGSLFYGTILGVFLVAFFVKFVRGRAVFLAALITEAIVISVFFLDYYEIFQIAYLWLNLIGCTLVLLISMLFQAIQNGVGPQEARV